MRKLLLASVAALGLAATAPGVGTAQQVEDAGQSTVSALGGAVQGVQQAPGTLVVRLNGRVYSQAGLLNINDVAGSYYYNPFTGTASETPFVSTTAPTSVGVATVGGVPTALPLFFGTAAQATRLGLRPASTAAGAQNVIVQTNQPQVNKASNYGVYSYFRLYPGVDGVAANGLKYGASVELRQDSNSNPSGQGSNGSISAQDTRQGFMYVRRAWGYAGTDKLGMVRFGGTDGPSDLFMVGNNENFGDAGWNGSAAAYLPVQLWIYWPFADSGNLYSTQKIMYLSPAFKGFDFGVAFAPSTAGPVGASVGQGCNSPNLFNASGVNGLFNAGPSVIGSGCAQLSSTNTGDYTRPRNMVDVGVRYRGLFGPVGFAAYADYIGSGTIHDNVATAHARVDGYSIGSGGAQVSFGGLTVGGMAIGGRYNGAGGFTLAPQGGAPETAVEFGGSYTYGPFIVGTHLFATWSAGNSAPAFNPDGTATGVAPSVGQRREQGIAVGATYSVAPGFALNLTYIWGERKETGYDFLTNQNTYTANAVNTTGCGPSGLAGQTQACLHNQVKSSGLMLGAQLTW